MLRLAIICALVASFLIPLSRSAPALADTQLISNGGFESGQSPWQESSAGGYQLIDPSKPHTGTESAWFCGVASCNDQLWQTVTLPSGSTQVTLSYFLAVTASASPCGDTFTVQIRTASGSPITSSSLGCPATSGWVQKTWSLGSALAGYGGQQVQVYVQATTASGSSSSFYVDDVTLTANGGSGGPPPATSTPTAAPTNTPTSGGGTTDGSCGSTVTACRNYVLNEVNNSRAQGGVGPLTLNVTQSVGNGTCGSDVHSLWLYQNGYGTWNPGLNPHQGFPSPELCVSYYMAGENVGMCSSSTEAGALQCIHNLFMSEGPCPDPGCPGTEFAQHGHYMNIMNGSYTSVGVGIYWDAPNHIVYLTEDFIG